MKNTFLILVGILGFMSLVACGSDERAATVKMPTATVHSAVVETEPTATATNAVIEEISPVPEPTETAVPTETTAPTETPEPTATPEPTNTPEPPITELDEVGLKASLLTINDMPTGWTGAAAEFEVLTPGGTYQFMCKEGLSARAIGRASVDFRKSALGPFLSEIVSVYDNRADAEAAFAELSEASGECLEWTDENGVTFSLSPLSFPRLGDETFAVRVMGNIEADYIFMRKGNVILSILNGAFPVGVDSAFTEEMARLALDLFVKNN